MANPRRVLAVPSTEDPSSPLNHRQKLSDDYLVKALEVVEATMKGDDPKLKYDAAKWVAEMVMGKPKQAIEQSGGVEAEMAKILALSYAAHLKSLDEAPAPSFEGGVYVLGPSPEESVESGFIREPRKLHNDVIG